MFRLESNRLKREFKITNGNFYASQIMNKCSEMGFVPDGNGCEFVVFFTDGTEVSSKGLPVVQSSEENERLKFVFAEDLGTTVTLEYWVHEDGNTVCKQITISQNNDKVIDRVFLENIGIINSKTHFGIDPKTHKDGADFVTSLGQPFYIDSLFFGCVNPAVDSKIIHGAGQIRYYLGKNVGKDFKCPVTVMGGGSDNTMQAMKKAFSEYIDFISVPSPLRFEFIDYNNDKKALPESVREDAANALMRMNAPDMPEFGGYTLANSFWAGDKGEFWSFNKKFGGFSEISAACRNENASLGIHIDLAGTKKLAKKIQKSGNGFVHSECDELCCASSRYNQEFTDYINSLISENGLGGVTLSFGRSEELFCTDESHDHCVGGKNEMYYLNDLIESRMALVQSIRSANPDVCILLCGMHDASPFWRQWVNAVDTSAFDDIKEELSDELSPVELTISTNDAVYYNALCRHALQLPADAMRTALKNGDYSNDEFYKLAMWSAVSGEGLMQLATDLTALDDVKRDKLSRALKFKAENQHILKNASFIGGNPAEGNIYGFISWTDDGEGVIALRNPSEEKTDLTLTLNCLMGVPEGLSEVRRENIYSLSIPETSQLYSYGDKIDLSLYPYECVIFKFTKED